MPRRGRASILHGVRRRSLLQPTVPEAPLAKAPAQGWAVHATTCLLLAIEAKYKL